MKSDKDPRHIARIACVQKLFADHFKTAIEKKDNTEQLELLLDENQNLDKKLYTKICNGVEKKLTMIDNIIKKFTPQWPFNLIKKTDLEILRIAIYEAFIGQITPPKVAIDEAIELAKEFRDETSSNFISGVLGSIHSKLNKK